MPGWEMMAKFFDENVTVLGRLCGGGNLYLDTVASIIAFIVLWAGTWRTIFPVNIAPRFNILSPDSRGEADFRQRLLAEKWTVTNWGVRYDPPAVLSSLNCELRWNARIVRVPTTPQAREQLRALPGVRSLSWTE